jgi:hypothetical protein
MKKILNVLWNSQLIIICKQIMVKENSGINNYNLQPVPAYRTITPVASDISKRRRTMPLLSVVVILLFVSVTFSSCFTSGYGCKGKSRIITRVR